MVWGAGPGAFWMGGRGGGGGTGAGVLKKEQGQTWGGERQHSELERTCFLNVPLIVKHQYRNFQFLRK